MYYKLCQLLKKKKTKKSRKKIENVSIMEYLKIPTVKKNVLKQQRQETNKIFIFANNGKSYFIDK